MRVPESNTSDSALNDRIAAMQSAVADEAGTRTYISTSTIVTASRRGQGTIQELFFGYERRIGHEFPGWKPYDAWATSPDGVDDEYLIDDGARLHT